MKGAYPKEKKIKKLKTAKHTQKQNILQQSREEWMGLFVNLTLASTYPS